MTYRVRSCPVCERIYAPTYNRQRTCGRACGVELRRRLGSLPEQQYPATRVWVKACTECAGVYIARHSETELCSRRCRLSRQRRHYRAARPLTEHECAECGSAFEAAGDQRYCSKACGKRAGARTRRHRLRSAGPAEDFTLREIAERDAWRCGICRRKVRADKVAPHPLSPSIDHVIPAAELGSHTRANVRLAHFHCNALRAHRGGGEQLALIG